MLEGSCVLVFHKTIKVILNSCLTIKMRWTEFKIFIVTSYTQSSLVLSLPHKIPRVTNCYLKLLLFLTMTTLFSCAVQNVLKLQFSFSYHCFSQKYTKHHSLLRKIPSQKDAILDINSAGQVSCGHSGSFLGNHRCTGGAPGVPDITPDRGRGRPPLLTGATLCNPRDSSSLQ